MAQFVDDMLTFTITPVTIVIDKYDPTSSVSSAAAAAVSAVPTDFPSLCVHVCSEGVLWGLHDNQLITNCGTTVSIFCFNFVYHYSRSDYSARISTRARARACVRVCVCVLCVLSLLRHLVHCLRASSSSGRRTRGSRSRCLGRWVGWLVD